MNSPFNVRAIEALLNTKGYNLVAEITAGYSGDKKYKLEKDGKMYLLRAGDKASSSAKQKEFEQLRLYQKANINAQRPVDFAVLDDIFYSIVTWIDGTSVMEIIKSDLNKDYYELGRKAGAELKKVHNLSLADSSINWYDFIKQKAEQLISSCKNINMGDIKDYAERYILDNLDLMKTRPSVILHGDYHWENCIINDKSEIGIIDFSGNIIGDPWYDFGDMMWVLEYSESFANGQLDGYFDTISDEFWRVFKLYTAIYALEHLSYNNGKNIDEHIFSASRMLKLFGKDFSADVPLFRRSVFSCAKA